MGIRHFNGLSHSEEERLVLLVEEAAEVQQIACKILRHGYECWNPNDPQRTHNRELLERELGDLHAIYELMNNADDIDIRNCLEACEEKKLRMAPYLHHQKEADRG